MSYDLNLYLSRETRLTPPDAGKGGQFAADLPARLETEDIPEEYQALVGKRRRWLNRIYIEGQPEPEALARFDDWLAGVILETNAVLIDEQAGRFQTAKTEDDLPSARAATGTGATLGDMSFFFEDVESFVPTALPAILKIIADVLPEAMPTRFGQYEPLQGKVENGDTSGLLKAFQEDPDQFMKAKAPFAHIYSNIASEAELMKWHPQHALRGHFLAGRLRFELRPKALTDPRLQPLFWEIARALGVFYAEIRATECPVQAWFWRGLPPGPVRAFALGPPYSGLWPEAEARATARDGALILVAPTRLQPELPQPPAKLMAPREPRRLWQFGFRRYARQFPFRTP